MSEVKLFGKKTLNAYKRVFGESLFVAFGEGLASIIARGIRICYTISICLEWQKNHINGESMDLFQTMEFKDLQPILETVVEDLVKKNELPDRGVIVEPNYGTAEKNKGQLISYLITSNEPDYPASDDDLLDKNRHHSLFFTLKAPSAKKWQGLVEIKSGSFLLDAVPPPPDALKVYKSKKSDDEEKSDDEDSSNIQEDNDQQNTGGVYDDRFRIPIDSPNLIKWVRDAVQHRISNYVTAAPSFSCCSEFEACSDAKKCIHPNRMYSTACSYRYNLEAGRIFYGKNRNV